MSGCVPDFQAFRGWNGTLSSTHGFLPSRQYAVSRVQRPLLKRSIPILITAFLLVVAISRISGIMVEYARMEASARQVTVLAAATASAALQENGVALFDKAQKWDVEQRLNAVLSPDMLETGAFVLTVRNDGRILRALRTVLFIPGARSMLSRRKLAAFPVFR